MKSIEFDIIDGEIEDVRYTGFTDKEIAVVQDNDDLSIACENEDELVELISTKTDSTITLTNCGFLYEPPRWDMDYGYYEVGESWLEYESLKVDPYKEVNESG